MMLSTLLPEDLPWADHRSFLLLDGATRPDLPALVARLAPAASKLALYDYPPFYALRDVSPLLVTVQQPDEPIFQFYLEHAHEEWGVLLFSQEPAHSVAQHLRKLLIVEPAEEHKTLLRLADAGVAHALFGSGDQRLFGPLSCVVTADHLGANWHRHAPRLPQPAELPTPFRLSPEQNAALNQVDRRRALLELDTHLLRFFPRYLVGETVAERWPRLEQLAAEASTLGLSSQSERYYYANVMAWLNGSTLDQHPHIAQLLHAPSLQSPGERVALAAHLAHRWATERERS